MDELKNRKIWAGYIPEKKSPLFSIGKDAKSSDRNTWQSYEDVTNKFNSRRGVFSDGTMLLIDFDHITINGNTPKKVDDKKALMWIKHCPTYLEWSPSGNGIHAIFFLEEKFKLDTHKVDVDNKIGRKYEFWGTEDNRFFTVTEDRINDKEILTITKEKAMQILLDLGYSPTEYTEIKRNESKDDVKVWDWFNQNKKIEDLLEPHGWSKVGNGQKQSWLRPGKKKGDGISATFNWNNNHMFRTFSSSVSGFDNEKSYTLFGVYTVLEHNGDIKKAVEQIKKDNPNIFNKGEEKKIVFNNEDFETIEADSIIKELQEETPPEMLKTGFKTLDTMTRGGFLPNDFIVLSGASKGGKTTMTKQLLQNCTEYNPTFIAIEDPVKDQMRREKIYGEIGKQGYRIVKKKQKIVTIDWLLELIKINKEKHNSKMFVIDNLDWIKDGTDYKKNIEIITKLKDLCDEINVCIILIVHIKSESEFNFGTRKPDIQRLKGGSHIYQMATKVIMIWRMMTKDGKHDVKDSGVTQCILSVDRWSGTMEGKMFMIFNKGKFEEINKDEYLRIIGESTPEKKIDITQFKKIDNFKDDL